MQFRETTAEARERILELRAQCFAEGDPEKQDPRFWDWQFANARHFIGEENGALLSHLALVELPHRIDGQLVPGVIAIDAMTSPAALVSRPHPAFGLFLRRGFVPGPHRFNLVVHPPTLVSRRWRVMWADTDHL